jgi:hypothetical protein
MGVFDSITGLFDSATSDVSSALDVGQSLLGGSDSGGGSFPMTLGPPAQYQTMQFSSPSYAMNVQAPAIIQGIMNVPRWAARFPTLWNTILSFRNQKIPMTIDKLYRALRTYGPTVLAGMISSAAVSELMLYKTSRKTRRMNVANVKSLRRSVRRLRGFEKLSHRVTAQLGRLSHSRGRPRSVRCNTCRKSPCRC